MALVDILMKRLQMQNPQGYNFVNQVRQSGRNPTEVLQEMYQKGQINDQQLAQVQRQGRMFGINISNADLSKIKAVENKPRVNPINKKFGGWF